LTVIAAEANVYRELVEQIQAHSAPDSYILAGPDCPEVYFLAARRNPSPVMYEFFRPGWFGEPQTLLADLDRRDVSVFVLNWLPAFSGRMPPALASALSTKFSSSRPIDLATPNPARQLERFRVFWHD
jgi:hypothetical protein